MEVIRLSGYTLEEKKAIARRHLIPKQLDENGVTEANLEFTEGGVEKIIEAYTREAGLRNLEREIGSICRKVAVAVAKGKTRRYRITGASVEKMLGPAKHLAEELLKRDQVGVATGLAWTPVGGDLLFIEALAVRGKGGLRLTGQLGDVMKESAQAAMSYARAHAKELGIAEDFFETHDVHVHVPEGSIPKDGPSAGITMATAMISAFTQPPRAARRRDDGRDHAARRGAPDRRRQGEGPRRAPGEDPHDHPAEAEPARRDADLLAHPARHRVPLRRARGRGPRDRALTPAAPSAEAPATAAGARAAPRDCRPAGQGRRPRPRRSAPRAPDRRSRAAQLLAVRLGNNGPDDPEDSLRPPPRGGAAALRARARRSRRRRGGRGRVRGAARP